jgi:hypothetical protein
MRKSWYLKYLKDHYPEIYDRSKQEFETYKVELLKFEKYTDNYTKPRTEADRQNLISIQSAFANLLNSLVNKNYDDHSFYTTYEVEEDKNEKFAKEYSRIPEGMLIKISKSNAFDSTYKEPDITFTINNNTDYYHTFIMNAYYMMFLNRANYLMNVFQYDTAEMYIKKVLEMRPGDKTANGMMKRVGELRTLGK